MISKIGLIYAKFEARPFAALRKSVMCKECCRASLVLLGRDKSRPARARLV